MAKKIVQIIDEHFELTKNNVVYIAGNYTKFHMLKMFGSALSIYDDTATLREDWNYYNAIHGDDFIRLLDGFMKEYNPIENYDRYEDTTVDFSKGTQIDDFQSAEKNGSIENKVSAFDTESYSNSNKSDTHSAGYTDISTSGSREDSTDTTSHIHGNIGVTTNAQMLQGEALIRYNDLVNKYIERWARGVLVGYDDYTGDNAGAASDDYATKAELNAVKNDVNDALADITELYSQVDEVSNNVNGLTDIVDGNTDDIADIGNMLTVNDSAFYFDYQNGKYGYNTDASRGADTFHPFSTGGGGDVTLKYLGSVYDTVSRVGSVGYDKSFTGLKGSILIYMSLVTQYPDCTVTKNGVNISPIMTTDNGLTTASRQLVATFRLDNVIETDTIALHYRRTTGNSSKQNLAYQILELS